MGLCLFTFSVLCLFAGCLVSGVGSLLLLCLVVASCLCVCLIGGVDV